jgi:hypothetical protein
MIGTLLVVFAKKLLIWSLVAFLHMKFFFGGILFNPQSIEEKKDDRGASSEK